MDDVKLGVVVRDKITGFRGRVTGLVSYLTGCNQALVVPQCKKDGSLPDSQWLDIERLDVTDRKALQLSDAPRLAAVGPDKPAPRR